MGRSQQRLQRNRRCLPAAGNLDVIAVKNQTARCSAEWICSRPSNGRCCSRINKRGPISCAKSGHFKKLQRSIGKLQHSLPFRPGLALLAYALGLISRNLPHDGQADLQSYLIRDTIKGRKRFRYPPFRGGFLGSHAHAATPAAMSSRVEPASAARRPSWAVWSGVSSAFWMRAPTGHLSFGGEACGLNRRLSSTAL